MMSNDQQPEISQVEWPLEVSPMDRPEVEIFSPHPNTPNGPGAGSPAQVANPIGFTVK